MFYSLPNTRSSTVTAVPEPWALKTETPPDYDTMSKEEITAWCARYETRHAIISAYEGVAPEVRVSKNKDNPPYRMHGLIVDYDAPLPDDPVTHITDKRQSEFLPTHLVVTSSHNARLVWQFEQPLLFTNDAHWREFLKLLTRNLKLNRWLGGLDTGALGNYATYYELGREWLPVAPDARIPLAISTLWFYQAAERQEFETEKSINYQIPMEDLAAEVNERWPGRWRGPFMEGARGVRFWDANADNETAAVVTKDGMLCYTGPQAFVPWRQILGTHFVEQYEAEAISDIMQFTVYDGQNFYRKIDEGGVWEMFSKPDFTQELRVMGKDATKRKGQTASEIDVIENRVKRYNRVKAAMPFLFFPPGIIRYGRDRFLNLSTVRPCTPVPKERFSHIKFSDGPELFPLIHSVLTNMFSSTDEEEHEEGRKQLTHLLAWLKYAYENAYEFTPRPGHTLVIAGAPGKGKTFLSWRIIAGLLGGRADAASHLVDGDTWTERLLEEPVMTIDDSSALADEKSRRAFTNKVKRYTANAEMLFNQKYVKTGSVPWYGRIVITCNLDAESLMILPDMDTSTADKICLFKTSDAKIPFTSWQENNKKAAQQLPYFARFLLDWEYPEHVIASERRFGVTPYHHPALFDTARGYGIGLLMELVSGFLNDFFTHYPEKEYWEGSATQLCADLGIRFPQMTKEINYRGMSIQLGKATAAGYHLERIQTEDNTVSKWRLYRDMFSRMEETKSDNATQR